MQPLDRRRFLSESAFLAAAAAAAPALGTLSAEEKAAANKPGSASDKLRVAVIGVRGRGRDHVGGFAGRHNCVVTTVCDVDKAVIGPAKGRTRWLTCPGRQVEPSSPDRIVNVHRRFAMRVFLGMILGALLLVAGVYVYDSQSTSTVANGQAAPANRTIVNWEVAATDWNLLKRRAQDDWIKLSSK